MSLYYLYVLNPEILKNLIFFLKKKLPKLMKHIKPYKTNLMYKMKFPSQNKIDDFKRYNIHFN